MSRLPDPIDPSAWPRPHGYANAMIAPAGKVIAVAGQIGWNPTTRQMVSDDFVAQTRKALENIVEVLRAAGAGPQEIIRLTWFITDKRTYVDKQKEVGDAYRSVMGKHFPAMSVVVVSALIEDRAKVEIEATAVLAK
jgi:enamine deaminase RidA (YjgF/YER057c/UK114 family)